MKKLLDNIKSYIQDLKSGEKKLSKDGMLILFFSGLLIYVILLPINNNSSYKNKAVEEKEQETTNYHVIMERHMELLVLNRHFLYHVMLLMQRWQREYLVRRL